MILNYNFTTGKKTSESARSADYHDQLSGQNISHLNHWFHSHIVLSVIGSKNGRGPLTLNLCTLAHISYIMV